MADSQIHYNIKNDTVFMSLCQLKVPLLLKYKCFIHSFKVLKWCFWISNGGLGSAVKLSNWDLNPWQKEVVLHKINRVLKTLCCFFLCIHTLVPSNCCIRARYEQYHTSSSAIWLYISMAVIQYTAMLHCYSCDTTNIYNPNSGNVGTFEMKTKRLSNHMSQYFIHNRT